MIQLIKRRDIPPVFVNAFYSECPNLISDFDHTSQLRKVSKNLHTDSNSTRDHNRLVFDDTFHTSLLHSTLRMTRYGLYDDTIAILAKMPSTEQFKMSTYEWQTQNYTMVEFIFKTAINDVNVNREKLTCMTVYHKNFLI